MVKICVRAQVHTKIIPGIYELLDGTVSVNQIRDVEIEDLLRRDPIRIDVADVEALLRGKRVLVTGGGGSIGSELCRQIARCEPTSLVILGHGENSVFAINQELRRRWGTTADGAGAGVDIEPVIADIRFPERVQDIFEQCRPQVVFHAAAHKHVPLMEHNPSEAITNNVVGTRNLLNASVAADVEQFVMISTDEVLVRRKFVVSQWRRGRFMCRPHERRWRTSAKPSTRPASWAPANGPPNSWSTRRPR